MNNGISPNAPAKEKIKSDFECLIRGMNWTGMIDSIAYDYLFDGAMPMFNKMYELGRKESTSWHPYPKEKPEKNGRYLITFMEGDADLFDLEIIVGTWDGKRFYISARDKNVLAWAEKPEPYQPENKQ